MKVNFYDNNIRHVGSYDECLEPGRKNINITYEYFSTNNDIYLFTDSHLTSAPSVAGKKVAWIMEPRAFAPSAHNFIEQNIDVFDKVLTFDASLLEKFPTKCTWIPADGIFLDSESIYNSHQKNKLCSHIFSQKRMLEGHRFRHKLAKNIISNSLEVDMFGNGASKYLDKKSDALCDYKFSFAIENNIQKTYFTEKIIDCFATRTIPIYRGAPNIGDWFDKRGIIEFETISDAIQIIESLSDTLYKKMIPFVEANYKACLQFYSVDQFIYEELGRL
jgi:hypothetical protein